jgi:hypothetical protein
MKPEDWIKKNRIEPGFPLLYKSDLVYYEGYDFTHVRVQLEGRSFFVCIEELSIIAHNTEAAEKWITKRGLQVDDIIVLQHSPKVGISYAPHPCTVYPDTSMYRCFKLIEVSPSAYRFLRVQDTVSKFEYWAPFYLFATTEELKNYVKPLSDVLHFYYNSSFDTICQQLKELIPNVKITYVIGIYKCSQTKFERKWREFAQMHVFYKISTNELIFSNTAKKDAIWNVPTYPTNDNWTLFKKMISDTFKVTNNSTSIDSAIPETSTNKTPVLKIEQKMFQQKSSTKKTKPLDW